MYFPKTVTVKRIFTETLELQGLPGDLGDLHELLEKKLLDILTKCHTPCLDENDHFVIKQ